ncbi:OmpP1/FadL family transporter [Echinimonas agarilytica]|uniref:Outer membrane protein transport protein n=1 Tax=Echinimonas agarilytica TaxID=1215918 RepID=A0AA41W619_9GAMM|nr:porin [Echinimonas agarilytica]MCM2679214.1 outer membrane protein transport protein [Echinimonas agarilytica]
MKILSTPCAIAVGCAFSILSPQVIAAGFQIHEHSANGLGRAFAGEAATVENASILARNPAAMSRFGTISMSGQLTYINPSVDLKGTTTNHLAEGYNTLAPIASGLSGQQLPSVDSQRPANAEDFAPSAVVPSFAVIVPINERWHVGLATFSNFGLSTEFSEGFNATEYGQKTELITININPNISYQVNQELSIGLGVNAVYADGSIRSSTPLYFNDDNAAYGAYNSIANGLNPQLPDGAQLPNLPQIPGGAKIGDVSGDGWDWGWNIGLLWAPTPDTDIGLTYRSEVNVDLEGDFNSDLLQMSNVPGSLGLDLPALAEFAVNHRMDDQWSVQASLNYTGWGTFEELTVDFDETTPIGDDILLKEENFEHSWRASLGLTYIMDEHWTIRGGYAYDDSPVKDEYRTISIPDTSRQWFTAGFTYELDKSSSIDVGAAFIHGRKESVHEEFLVDGSPITTLDATLDKVNAYLFSAQYNYAF